MNRRHRVTSQPMAQINVTSLLDITFVLLITFMIVAPALRYGIELQLPEVTDAPVVNPSDPIAITIHPSGDGAEFRLDGKQIEESDLAEAVISKAGGDVTRQAITLESDKSIPWQYVATVIADLRSQGIENIGIMTEIES